MISARATFCSDLDFYTRLLSTSHLEPSVLGHHTFASLLFFDLHILFTYQFSERSLPLYHLICRTLPDGLPDLHWLEAAELLLKKMAHAIYVTDGRSQVHSASQTDWNAHSLVEHSGRPPQFPFAIWFYLLCFCRRTLSASRQGRLLHSFTNLMKNGTIWETASLDRFETNSERCPGWIFKIGDLGNLKG